MPNRLTAVTVVCGRGEAESAIKALNYIMPPACPLEPFGPNPQLTPVRHFGAFIPSTYAFNLPMLIEQFRAHFWLEPLKAVLIVHLPEAAVAIYRTLELEKLSK